MAKIKLRIKNKKTSSSLAPANRASIPDDSKTKGGGLESFDPYKENKSSEGIGVGGLLKSRIEKPKIITGFK